MNTCASEAMLSLCQKPILPILPATLQAQRVRRQLTKPHASACQRDRQTGRRVGQALAGPASHCMASKPVEKEQVLAWIGDNSYSCVAPTWQHL